MPPSERVAQRRHERRQVGHRLRVGGELGDREGDVHRAKRDDERGQLHLGDQQAVGEAEEHRHAKAGRHRERGRHAEVDREPAHHDATERHHHAAGEIDAGGEDDDRLSDRDDAHDGHLLQDEREVLTREEAVGLGGEERGSGQQREEGAEYRDPHFLPQQRSIPSSGRRSARRPAVSP